MPIVLLTDESGKLYYQTGNPPILIDENCGGTCCGVECLCPDGTPRPESCCNENPGGLGCGCDPGGGGRPPEVIPPGGGVIPPCCPDGCPGPWCGPPTNTAQCCPHTCEYYLFSPYISGSGNVDVDFRQYRTCSGVTQCREQCVASGSGGTAGTNSATCGAVSYLSTSSNQYNTWSCNPFPPNTGSIGFSTTLGRSFGNVRAAESLGICGICDAVVSGDASGVYTTSNCGAGYSVNGSMTYLQSASGCVFYTAGNVSLTYSATTGPPGNCPLNGSSSANAQLNNYYRCPTPSMLALMAASPLSSEETLIAFNEMISRAVRVPRKEAFKIANTKVWTPGKKLIVPLTPGVKAMNSKVSNKVEECKPCGHGSVDPSKL